MSVKDDYPAITILADACADKADDSVPEAVRAWREVARLRQWKDEAVTVLAEWDDVHYECAGASAHIGRSKAENVRRELRRIRGQCDAWMNGVADIVEPWGYDRRAASGPGDLLPGLTSLAERLRECVEARRYLYEQVVDLTAKPPAPGLRDGIRERPSTWPPDSGDPVEDRNLPAAPTEVGDDPAGSDGSTATLGAAVGTGESPAPTSPDPELGTPRVTFGLSAWWTASAELEYEYCELGTQGVTHVAVPLGEYLRFAGSEAHAPDEVGES